MADKKPFKVGALTDPKFLFERHDGARADFDPWAFLKAVENVGGGIEAQADAVRKFVGYPTQAEVDEADSASAANPHAEYTRPVTLSLNEVNELTAAVGEFIAELPGTKKKLAIQQSSSPSGSSPRS